MKAHHLVHNGKRYEVNRVTEVLSNTASSEGLIRWYPSEERKAVLDMLEMGWSLDQIKEYVSSSKPFAAELKARAAADFGTEVHRVIQVYNETGFILDTVAPGVLERLNWWRSMALEHNVSITKCEQTYYSTILGVRGTLDAEGVAGQDSVLFDYKTGTLRYDAAEQLAGYALLRAERLLCDTPEDREAARGDYYASNQCIFETAYTDCTVPNIEFPRLIVISLHDKPDWYEVENPREHAQSFLWRVAVAKNRQTIKPFVHTINGKLRLVKGGV